MLLRPFTTYKTRPGPTRCGAGAATLSGTGRQDRRWVHGLSEGLRTKSKLLTRCRKGFRNRDRYQPKSFLGLPQ